MFNGRLSVLGFRADRVNSGLLFRHLVEISKLLFICLAVTVVYRSATKLFFAQDDFVFLWRASQVHSWVDFWRLFFAPDHFYRPLPRVAVLTGERLLFGLNPFWYHLTSVAIHILNTVLLYVVLNRLFDRWNIALGAALFYGLHSLHFLAVYWLSGIQELSVALFSLLTVLGYIVWRSMNAPLSYALSLLFFAQGLLSKEMAFTLPFLLVLVDVTGLQQGKWRWNRTLTAHTDKLGYGVVAALFLLLRVQKAGGLPTTGPYAWKPSASVLFANLRIYMSDIFYLRHLAYGNPFGSTLLTLVAFTFMGLLAWRLPKSRPIVIFAVGWFLLSIIPVIFLTNQNYSYYLNVPLMGFAVGVAEMAKSLWQVLWRFLAARGGTRVRELHGLVLALVIGGWLIFCADQIAEMEKKDPGSIVFKSRAAQQAVMEVMASYPDLPANSTLYVLGASARDVWAFGRGDLFRVFYDKDIEVLFDVHTPLPDDILQGQNLYTYEFSAQ